MKRLMLLWLGIALALAGMTGGALYLWQTKSSPIAIQPAKAAQSVANQSTTTSQGKKITQPISGKPVRLVISRLDIDIKIVDGYYNASARKWTVSSTAANYATNTPLANNTRGITFIYGHDISSILAPTQHIVAGDMASVYTDNEHQFNYRFISKMIVAPTDTSLFEQLDGAPGMKLMTCDGFWSQNRRIMNFDLVEVK